MRFEEALTGLLILVILSWLTNYAQTCLGHISTNDRGW